VAEVDQEPGFVREVMAVREVVVLEGEMGEMAEISRLFVSDALITRY
jgi:hypothetical protein